MHPIHFDHKFLELVCCVHRQHGVLAFVFGIRYKHILGWGNIVLRNDLMKCCTSLGYIGVLSLIKPIS